jgi:hypothetical protein
MQPAFKGEKITLYNYNEAVFMSNGFGVFGNTVGKFTFLYALMTKEKIPT